MSMPNPKRTAIRVQKVRLYPDAEMKQVLAYKCEWYGRRLIIADKFHPSTQRCSKCGHIKQKDEKITLEGNRKHRTRHDEYICYRCGAVMDRDENAVMNLLALA